MRRQYAHRMMLSIYLWELKDNTPELEWKLLRKAFTSQEGVDYALKKNYTF